MRLFTKFSPRTWTSKIFRSLPDNEARLLYLYVKTSSHQDTAGISKLPLAYAAADLQWEVEQVEASLRDCVSAGALIWDEETEEVFVADWFSHNGPMNIKHRIGVVNSIANAESVELREIATRELKEVYFDENLSKPNKRPDPSELNNDSSSGTVVTMSNSALGSKPPHKETREEFDKRLSAKRRVR